MRCRGRLRAGLLSAAACMTLIVGLAGGAVRAEDIPDDTEMTLTADSPLQGLGLGGERQRRLPPSIAGSTPRIPWFRVVSGLTVVTALIIAGVALLRRLNGGSLLRRGRYLDVLETRPVAGKMNLFLVRVAGRVVLLAANGESIASVCEFGADELPDVQAAAATESAEGFKGLLKKLAGAHG